MSKITESIKRKFKKYIFDFPQFYRDIRNYRLLINSVKHFDNLGKLKNMNIDYNWFYVPYTFINYSYDEMQETEEIKMALFRERIKNVVIFFEKEMRIDDLLFMNTMPVLDSKKGYCGYLVTFRPVLPSFKLLNFIRLFLIIYLSYIFTPHIYKFIENLNIF